MHFNLFSKTWPSEHYYEIVITSRAFPKLINSQLIGTADPRFYLTKNSAMQRRSAPRLDEKYRFRKVSATNLCVNV